ncbi:hypothetical protein CRENBAI_021024 [Crenichthys baileyi]|uniref:Uncharacterized protein n=1 Tax=Crenichthys baileyi TaxID=28760 RepID=A0AAV9SNG5_9TELE
MLQERQDFKFFLELFHHIVPHVDLLYAELQEKNINSSKILSIPLVSKAVTLCQQRRRVLNSEYHQGVAEEACNTILVHTWERFSFTDHLVCATVLQGDRFEKHHRSFPEDALQNTLKAYPMVNGSKLKTDLGLIYSKDEFRACCGAVDLFQLFMR